MHTTKNKRAQASTSAWRNGECSATIRLAARIAMIF